MTEENPPDDAGHDKAAPLNPQPGDRQTLPPRPGSAAPSFRPEIARRVPDIPGMPRAPAEPTAGEAKKLTVGKEIVLNGEITACDRLVVEGRVEAAMNQGRVIEIADSGLFKGDVTVEEATIAGRFEGKLTVTGTLCVRQGGRIVGEVRYGRLEVEAGGEISGTIQTLAEAEQARPDNPAT